MRFDVDLYAGAAEILLPRTDQLKSERSTAVAAFFGARFLVVFAGAEPG